MPTRDPQASADALATPGAPTQPAIDAAPALDRRALRAALLAPGAAEVTSAMLIAIAGLGAAGDLDIAAAAANLSLHPNRVRSWLRRAHDDKYAGPIVTEALAHAYGDPATGDLDLDAAAQGLGVHVSTVRRWGREPMRPAAAAEVLHQILASSGPRPVASHVGTVNTPAAAGLLHVSPATIRRWLRTGCPALPPTRVEQLLQLTEPTSQILTREALNLQHAQDCIARLRLGRGRGGMTEQYGQTGWLEPHVVSVLEMSGTGLRRVAVTRVNTRPLQRIRRAATVVDFTLPLPHKFAATLVRHAVLDAVASWRVEAIAGALDALDKGRTQAWIAAAPLPALDAVARTHR